MDTGAEGGNVVVVKVRETYDLHTIQNKMTVIAIHTPKPEILKRNYPGLLMQCRAYRPVSCDVRLACASMLPLDPLGIGTEVGDVSPEDVFNPILYKAMSNFGMSQLEARINSMVHNSVTPADISGSIADADVDSFTDLTDDFNLYYGLLAETNAWKHANPQQGLSMSNLKPLVWELLYNVGDTSGQSTSNPMYAAPQADGVGNSSTAFAIRGNAKPMPFINCTSYSKGAAAGTGEEPAGFKDLPWNAEQNIPYLNVVCGAIIIPPSRLHSLYFRMVCEWDIEFSTIRSISDLFSFGGLATIGAATHYQNYSYENTKEALTGDPSTILEKDSCMVSSNVDVTKVM